MNDPRQQNPADNGVGSTGGSAIREMHLGTMTDDEQRRCLEIGKRIPSLRWWYSMHDKLGCSPRDAVDAGRFADVEALLPNIAVSQPGQPLPKSSNSPANP